MNLIKKAVDALNHFYDVPVDPKPPSHGSKSGPVAGKRHREEVKRFLLEYPGITGVEIGEKMGLNHQTVSRHIRAIRMEWGGVKAYRKQSDALED